MLPGLWLEGINGDFAIVAKQVPPDPTVAELTEAIVLDLPAYTRGLVQRFELQDTEWPTLSKELYIAHKDLSDSYAEHPLELEVYGEDIRKLVMISCILAGAESILINRPVDAVLDHSCRPILRSVENARHMWGRPTDRKQRDLDSEKLRIPSLDMTEVSKYCEQLEPYFRAVRWHSGRMAVALGAFLSYALGSDDGQGFLALMTTFEALLSTTKAEITHQICERLAFMLDESEDGRYNIYKRMQALYDTRSRLIHGDIQNKSGIIRYSDLRLDAKMTIVPDADYSDLFDFSVRLFKAVLVDPILLFHLEKKNSPGLKEYYLRVTFRGQRRIEPLS